MGRHTASVLLTARRSRGRAGHGHCLVSLIVVTIVRTRGGGLPVSGALPKHRQHLT